MPGATIQCTACGAASATALALCAKCKGKNARVCSGCGFQNSLAKNYCDKCGNPIAELGTGTPPAGPSELKSDIPATIVKHRKDSDQALTSLPSAKSSAAEPGAPRGEVPLPAAKQAADPFNAPQVSNDPWAATAPASQAETKPRIQKWVAPLRRILTAAFATAAIVGSLAGVWHITENAKPENAAHLAALRYLEALRTKNYAAAYSQFSDSAKKNCTLEEFVASRDSAAWTWSGLRVERMEQGASFLTYELAVEGATPRTDGVLFVLENKKWVRPFTATLMRKVEAAFDANNPDLGLTLAQAAAAIDPREPLARVYLCDAAYYHKSPEDAERQCSAAIELERNYPSNLPLKTRYRLHAILADTYKNSLNKPELSLTQFTQMLLFPDISPADQCEIYLALSEVHQSLSRPGEALADTDLAAQTCVRPQELAYIKDIRLKLNAPPIQ